MAWNEYLLIFLVIVFAVSFVGHYGVASFFQSVRNLFRGL